MVLVTLVLALPLLGASPRWVTFFLADFDAVLSSHGDSHFVAQGGQISVDEPRDAAIFSAVSDGTGGNKVLLVAPNTSNESARLVGELDQPTDSNVVEVLFRVQLMGGASGLVVGIEDDDGTGMIDIIFEDDRISVDGDSIALPGEAASTESGSSPFLRVRLELRKSLMGLMTWSLEVEAPGQGMEAIGGPLFHPGLLSVGAVTLTRPPSGPVGSYAIDDLEVSGPAMLLHVSAIDESP